MDWEVLSYLNFTLMEPPWLLVLRCFEDAENDFVGKFFFLSFKIFVQIDGGGGPYILGIAWNSN